MKQLELGLDITPAQKFLRDHLETTYNPLGYWCPPNGPTPDYVATGSLENLIGYGFICCWLDEDNCSFSNEMHESFISDLRETFLSTLEFAAFGLWGGDIKPGDSDFDGSHFDTLFINEDENQDTYLVWRLHSIEELSDENDDPCLGFELDCPGSDPEVIWLRMSALKDKAFFRACVAHARRINHAPSALKAEPRHYYQKHGIPNIYPEYLAYVKANENPKPMDYWYEWDFKFHIGAGD